MFSEAFWGEVLKLIVPTLSGIAGIIVALRALSRTDVDRARRKQQRKTDHETETQNGPQPYDEFQAIEQRARDKEKK